MSRTFRVGFVGAGDIAPVHIEAVQALIAGGAADIEIVGIADLDEQRAQKRADEYGIPAYRSLDDLLSHGANTIHVITPPAAHAAVAVAAMEAGCDVFIEKPLAESVADCEAVEAAANRTGRVATVDHLMLFDPQIDDALTAVKAGKIGRVVSVDIIRGGEPLPYEGGPLPEILAKAGHPFRDLGVHNLSIFQAFLGPIEEVAAEWDSLGGEPSIPFDEWRCLVKCRDGFGQFSISYNAKPIQNQIFIHGTKGMLRIDPFSLFTTSRMNSPLPRPVERLVNVGVESLSAIAQAPVSIAKFATKKLQRMQGMRNHIDVFYDHLRRGEPMPVTLQDATELVRHLEGVAQDAEADYARRLAPFLDHPDSVDVLVTGASGSVGRNALHRMMADGRTVRAFVRRIPPQPIDGVDYVIGNLGDPEAVRTAVKGASIVIHAGATIKGSEADHLSGTVVGTRNVVDACLEFGVEQLIHVSSMSVVDQLGAHEGRPVDEAIDYEPQPAKRGAYTQSKLDAERIVLDAVAERALPAVILRPGVIFGGGVDLITGAVAMGGGSRWIVLGDGDVTVSLVYMDDVIDAIDAAIDRELHDGEIIQLVDPVQLTQNEILAALGDDKPVAHVPRALLFNIGKATEPLFAKLGKESPLGKYRLQSAMSKQTYAGFNATKLLDWSPKVGVREGIRREVAHNS